MLKMDIRVEVCGFALDVALEALRDCYRSRKCTMDELWKYAKICRVANIMKPYLESLV